MAPGEGIRGESFSNRIRAMFDTIAPTYDLLNRVNSFGLDIHWRKDLVNRVSNEHPSMILDLATGTADLSIMLAKKCNGATVVATDLSIGMLAIGEQKAREAGLDQIKFALADALHLPFDNESFDVATCAFGIRNFESIQKGYEEFNRVLRPGGMVAVLELCEPESRLLNLAYNVHMRAIVPVISSFIGHHRDAYTYLADSIHKVPHRSGMEKLMQKAGLVNTYYKVYTPGVCCLYVGYKPLRDEVYQQKERILGLQRKG